MTQPTNQERAEFIKFASDVLEANTEDCLLFEDEFADPLTNAAWFAWQAARRAQVVPIGWRLVPDANNMTDEQAEAICNLVGCCGGGANEVYEAALAAAPQQAEADHIPDVGKMVASPVQMPEPVAIITDTVPREPGWKTMFVPDAGTNLYTEHQVRQLLARHGIK